MGLLSNLTNPYELAMQQNPQSPQAQTIMPWQGQSFSPSPAQPQGTVQSILTNRQPQQQNPLDLLQAINQISQPTGQDIGNAAIARYSQRNPGITAEQMTGQRMAPNLAILKQLSDMNLQNAQAQFFMGGGQAGQKPEAVFDNTLNNGQGGYRYASTREVTNNQNLAPAADVPPGFKNAAFSGPIPPKAQQIFSDNNLPSQPVPPTADEMKDNQKDYQQAQGAHDAAMSAARIATQAIAPAQNYAAGGGGMTDMLASGNAIIGGPSSALANRQLLNKYSGQMASALAQQSKGIRIGVGMEKFMKSTTISTDNAPQVNQEIIQNVQQMPTVTQQQKDMEAYIQQFSPQYKEAIRDRFYQEYPMMMEDNGDVAKINPAYQDPQLFRKWINQQPAQNAANPVDGGVFGNNSNAQLPPDVAAGGTSADSLLNNKQLNSNPAQPQPIKSALTGQRVNIITPDGKSGTIDAAHLQDLISAGGKVAQ